MALVRSIHKVARQHLLAWKQKREQHSITRWSLPPIGTIKVNFDVAVRDTFVVGATVIKDHGVVVTAVVQKISVEDPKDGQIGMEDTRKSGLLRLGWRKQENVVF